MNEWPWTWRCPTQLSVESVWALAQQQTTIRQNVDWRCELQVVDLEDEDDCKQKTVYLTTPQALANPSDQGHITGLFPLDSSHSPVPLNCCWICPAGFPPQLKHTTYPPPDSPVSPRIVSFLSGQGHIWLWDFHSPGAKVTLSEQMSG